MHTLLPNTKYKIVTVKLAIPAIDDAAITDGLNDLFRSQCAEDWIADWEYPQQMFPVKTTSEQPEEGELFQSPARSRPNGKHKSNLQAASVSGSPS